MGNYEKAQIDDKFTTAKRMLDRGQYKECILAFTELIEISASELDNSDAEITFQTSLNNRGMAQCMIARQTRDKQLYIKGMGDYKKSVDAANEPEDANLTARLNLRFAEEEFKHFDEPDGFKPGGFKIA